MRQDTPFLIVGAGPFGLCMAAYAHSLGIDHLILGEAMRFWQANMPAKMFLRSACDWHLDPLAIETIEQYLALQGKKPADVEPLSLAFYLGYVRWFQEQKAIRPIPAVVERLDLIDEGEYRFQATLGDGGSVRAANVLLAVGFQYFKHIPAEISALIPTGRLSHTCDRVDFTPLVGKRVLILGGRQSAFEWAALLHEEGASAIHVVHRHATPTFTESDWSWVPPLVDAMVENPGWYRNLSPTEKQEVGQRLWGEGRLKLEPWLAPRIAKANVQLWPNAKITGCETLPNGELKVILDNGEHLHVDHLIAATGYKVNVEQVPFLARGNLLSRLATANGYPVLDEHFQTSIPGLFATSMMATQDFGPFFGFTVAVRAAAKIVGNAIQAERLSA